MIPKLQRKWMMAAAAAMLLLPLALVSAVRQPPRDVRGVYGPHFKKEARTSPESVHGRHHSASAADALRYWNTIAVDASGLDHTPPAADETRHFGEQLGPGRASRAMAIVHIAMFDAVDAIVGGYESYTHLRRAPRNASLEAAIAQAAHDTLVKLFPSQRESFDALLSEDLDQVSSRDRRKDLGIEVGQRAAAAILALRADDLDGPDPRLGIEYFTSDDPGHWRQDPISHSPIALGAQWGKMKPFVMRSASQFRAPPPPPMTALEYATAFDEVKALGGDGVHTPTQRTAEQTQIGDFLGLRWHAEPVRAAAPL